MLNAKELRIGNWVLESINKTNYFDSPEWKYPFERGDFEVKHWNESVPVRVDSIVDISGFHYINPYLDADGCWEYAGEMQPIPLTPEILKKCGFMHQCGELWGHKDQYFNLFVYAGHMCFTADQHHDTSEPIKYLHQLQNLYFALTGQELQVLL